MRLFTRFGATKDNRIQRSFNPGSGFWIWRQPPRQKEKGMELVVEPDPFRWDASQRVRSGASIKAGDTLCRETEDGWGPTPPCFPDMCYSPPQAFSPISDATIKVKQNRTTSLNRRLNVGLPSKMPPLSFHKRTANSQTIEIHSEDFNGSGWRPEQVIQLWQLSETPTSGDCEVFLLSSLTGSYLRRREFNLNGAYFQGGHSKQILF